MRHRECSVFVYTLQFRKLVAVSREAPSLLTLFIAGRVLPSSFARKWPTWRHSTTPGVGAVSVVPCRLRVLLPAAQDRFQSLAPGRLWGRLRLVLVS